MSVLEFIDSEVFNPVYGNDVPLVQNKNIINICKELQYAIRNKETIFIYGDYDMDGFSSMMVWRETLGALRAPSPVLFHYQNRMHNLDPDIIRQVKATDARVVIICDTGSSLEDRRVLSMLEMEGYTTIVIDHHTYIGDYAIECENRLTFNAYEERAALAHCDISGAYASAIVAKVLCEKFMDTPLPFNAKVFALASMYADVVDMSSPLARALYNSVGIVNAKGPALFEELNTWGYMYGRRFFSYIVIPKINGCFRTEKFDLLNAVLDAKDKYKIRELCTQMCEVHSYAKQLSESLVGAFTRENYGDFVLCTHTVTDETRMLHVRNFTGLIATKVAQEEMTMAVVVTKDGTLYEGSYRDYHGRDMLDTFNLFCTAGGHPNAFGLSFNDIKQFTRHLELISRQAQDSVEKQTVFMNSGVIESDEDYNALALYNEYMNTRPRVIISHICSDTKLVRATAHSKYYKVGLAGDKTVMVTRPLTDGMKVMLEPAICRGVELRELV